MNRAALKSICGRYTPPIGFGSQYDVAEDGRFLINVTAGVIPTLIAERQAGVR
jgi:hypothetical protein